MPNNNLSREHFQADTQETAEEFNNFFVKNSKFMTDSNFYIATDSSSMVAYVFQQHHIIKLTILLFLLFLTSPELAQCKNVYINIIKELKKKTIH